MARKASFEVSVWRWLSLCRSQSPAPRLRNLVMTFPSCIRSTQTDPEVTLLSVRWLPRVSVSVIIAPTSEPRSAAQDPTQFPRRSFVAGLMSSARRASSAKKMDFASRPIPLTGARVHIYPERITTGDSRAPNWWSPQTSPLDSRTPNLSTMMTGIAYRTVRPRFIAMSSP